MVRLPLFYGARDVIFFVVAHVFLNMYMATHEKPRLLSPISPPSLTPHSPHQNKTSLRPSKCPSPPILRLSFFLHALRPGTQLPPQDLSRVAQTCRSESTNRFYTPTGETRARKYK